MLVIIICALTHVTSLPNHKILEFSNFISFFLTSSRMKELTNDQAPVVNGEEFREWILYEDDDLISLSKPGWLVCHPSKNGPMSSLVGATKKYLEVDTIHLVSRLDRETSGVVLFAKHRKSASYWQKGVECKSVKRGYLAILNGVMQKQESIDGYIGNDPMSKVFVKQKITRKSRNSKFAETTFIPLINGKNQTLCLVLTATGRKHQIRVHAHGLGFSLVGDKLYGPDEDYYLKFCETGWMDEWFSSLGMSRQALHSRWLMDLNSGQLFTAPFPQDMKDFIEINFKVCVPDIKQVLSNADEHFIKEIEAFKVM